jgi:hypothetical protein
MVCAYCLLSRSWKPLLFLFAAASLLAFKNAQKDPDNMLSNWQGSDPCGVPWQGIYCETNATTNVSHVIEM